MTLLVALVLLRLILLLVSIRSTSKPGRGLVLPTHLGRLVGVVLLLLGRLLLSGSFDRSGLLVEYLYSQICISIVCRRKKGEEKG